MTSPSPFQRFLAELRRRHVPQTGAVYVVAAWAAIQFADVVVPNLGWPQVVVTAVIIAAAVGLPIVLVLSWLLEWGPDGIHRTDGEPDAEAERAPATERAPTAAPATAPSRRQHAPWVTAVGVLVVGIGIAIAVVGMLDRADGSAETGDVASGSDDAPTRFDRRRGEHAAPPSPPLHEITSPAFADSLVRAINDSIARGLAGGAGADLDALVEMATRLGDAVGPAGTGGVIEILEPRAWGFGAPHPVALGDTLMVRGVARAEGGVAAVELDGRVVASVASGAAAPSVLAFEAVWVARDGVGAQSIPITVRGADGGEVTREFPVRVVPADLDR